MLLIRSSISCLACYVCSFVVITSHFTNVDERDICSMFVTEGRFSSFFKSRIHSVLIYVVGGDDSGIMNELILFNYLMFYGV